MFRELDQYYEEEKDDANYLADIKERMEGLQTILIVEERKVHRSQTVNVRPTSLDDPRFHGLRQKLLKYKKAYYLLVICISVYIINALRPLTKGRKGKGIILLQHNVFSIAFLTHILVTQQTAGINVTKRLDGQIKSEWKKAEVAIEAYNNTVKEQGMFEIKN